MLVVGRGPAGFAAALAARRAGASEALLVERYNHLGGLSTGGLVIKLPEARGEVVARTRSKAPVGSRMGSRGLTVVLEW